MAKIDNFNPEEYPPNCQRPGLRNNPGTTSQVIVIGDSLDGLNIYVRRRNQSAVLWEGPLSSTGIAGRWKVTLTRKSSVASPEDVGVQLGSGTGDPGDVPITVTAGTSPSATSASLDTAVPVG